MPIKFPHLFQTDKNDCGLACIRMLVKHYNIRNVCYSKIPKEKLSIYDLKIYLEEVGISSKALQIYSEEGLRKLSFPYIALFNDYHFVIIYDHRDGCYHIADPSKGNIILPKSRLLQLVFNNSDQVGKIITVRKPNNQEFEEVDKKPVKYSTFLFKCFKKYLSSFKGLILLIFIITLLQALTPFFFRAIIDLGINKDSLSVVNILVLANLILIIGIGLGNIIKERLSNSISEEFKYRLIEDYLKKTLSALNILNQLKVGHVLKKIKDIETVNSFLTNNLVYFLTSCLITILYLIILFVFDELIFGIFLSSVIIYIAWQLSFTSYLKLLENASRVLQIKERNFWADTITSIYDIKSYNAEGTQINQWRDIHKNLEKNAFNDLKIKNIQQFGNHLINGVKALFILYFSVTKVINGEMTFGTMISIQFIVGFLFNPINSIINFIGYYIHFKILLSRLEEDHQQSNQYEQRGKEFNIANIDNIHFFNSSLTYPGSSHTALSNIDFKITKGKKYAIIGKSGSGKSTFIKLILGLYPPSEGRMEINDVSISEINPKSYREHFSTVLQESRLIEGTFIDNITYKEDSVNFEWLNEVVKLTNLEDILSQYRKGIFSEINNGSKGISDGQKQRILIARALYHNRHFLVLDEATSSLDSYNKFVIFKNILKKYQDKTLLVCTHDINLIKDFDVIVVLSNGKIVEVGNHENLIKKRGFYSVLYNIQNKN